MRFLLLPFLFISLSVSAQKQRIVPINTFPMNATVLFTLEGTKDRAVLKVDRIEANDYDIKEGDTLICTFFWSILPVEDEMARFPGVGAGDEISLHMGVKKSAVDGSWQYTAYHYKNRTRMQAKALKAEKAEAPKAP